MIRYENTTTAQRIAAFPRAVYRITIERNPLSALSFATGTLSWRRVVRDIVDKSANPAAFALGGAAEAVLDSDRVATLDFQAKATAGNSTTVADLLTAVENASRYARIVSVRREAPIGGISAGGIDQLAADRAGVNQSEQERFQASSLTARIGDAITGTKRVLLVLAVVAVAVAAYRLFPTKASTAP